MVGIAGMADMAGGEIDKKILSVSANIIGFLIQTVWIRGPIIRDIVLTR